MTEITLTTKVPSDDGCEGCQFFTHFSYRDQPQCSLFALDVNGVSQNFTKCQPCAELASLQKDSSNKVRAITAEELTAQFLEHIHILVDHWAITDREDIHAKLAGLAFSILAMLDGESLELPAFDIVARPHESDKDYFIKKGENYIEDGTVLEPWLHEKWYNG